MTIQEQDLINQIKNSKNTIARPLSEDDANTDKKIVQKKNLTSNGKLSKNKSSNVGRKPTHNETVQFRCPRATLEALEKKIERLNSKGLGLDRKEVMVLLVSNAAQLPSTEFHELIMAERLRS